MMQNPEPMRRPALLVLARFWGRGPVKTRLAADIGQDRARQVYKKMAEDFWNGAEHRRWQRWLFCEPAGSCAEMRDWLTGADQLLPQPNGDLGERLRSAVNQAFANPRPWVAVAGTDAPELNAERISEAAEHLKTADVVIQPTFDGGYALLMMKESMPTLFADMPWSTDQVRARTIDRILELGKTVYCLPPIRDVDTIDDLRRFNM